uniref:Secreted protein n=1 Tax=Streptomyces sp. NBC_00049 TaxID=2903617 RepID=A0AAU2JRL3_9ACTN
MTEPTNDPKTAVQTAAQSAVPTAVPTPVPDAAAPAPASAGSRVKAGPLVVGVLSLAVLVGTGVWASATVDDADRSAPTAYWAAAGAEPQKAPEPESVPANAVSAKLLPVPASYELGPDFGVQGNDFVVSGDKAVEGFKEVRKGLSTAERKKRDEMLGELKLKGQAGRTYMKWAGNLVVEVRIVQADPQALNTFAGITKKFLEAIGDDREGPKVDGYPDAKCSLMAVGEEKEEKIDSVYCVAVEGDVMVDFRAYGPKSGFYTTDAVEFLKNQLNHLKSPGESA